MNLVEAEVAHGQLRFGGYAIPLPATDTPDGQVIAGIRPEAFEDAAFADPSLPRIDVKVEVVEELGADTHVLFSIAAPRVEVTEVREAAGDEDATLAAVEGSLFTARVDPATSAKPGATLRLAVDPSRFHYFDPETGLRLEPDRARSRPSLPEPLQGRPTVRALAERGNADREPRAVASRRPHVPPVSRRLANAAGRSSTRSPQSCPHSQRNSPGRSGSAASSRS